MILINIISGHPLGKQGIENQLSNQSPVLCLGLSVAAISRLLKALGTQNAHDKRNRRASLCQIFRELHLLFQKFILVFTSYYSIHQEIIAICSKITLLKKSVKVSCTNLHIL